MPRRVLCSNSVVQCSHLANVRDHPSSLSRAQVASVPACIILSTKNVSTHFFLILFYPSRTKAQSLHQTAWTRVAKKHGLLQHVRRSLDAFYCCGRGSRRPGLSSPSCRWEFMAYSRRYLRITQTCSTRKKKHVTILHLTGFPMLRDTGIVNPSRLSSLFAVGSSQTCRQFLLAHASVSGQIDYP